MGFQFPPLTPVIKRVLLVLVGVFAVQLIVSAMGGFDTLSYHSAVVVRLGLDIRALAQGAVWQPFTYGLIHSVSGWGHLLGNAMGLYFLGGAIEQMMGSKSVRNLLVGSVLAGAASTLIFQGIGWATGAWLSVPVVGISAGVSGLAAAFCVVNWDRRVYLFFIPMQGKHLLALIVGIELLMGIQLAMGTGNVAVHCHAGGLLYGWLWVNGYHTPRRAFSGLRVWWLRRRLRVVHSRDPDEQPQYLN